MVVLDTDHVTLLERSEQGPGARLLARTKVLPKEEVAATIVSYEEQLRGWLTYLAKAKTVKDQVEAYGRVRRMLVHYCAMTVLPFDELAAVEFQRLKGHKLRVGTMDLKIAAIALANRATVLTRNVGDFTKVPGLRIEDWTRE
ncbi:MAG: type II toxin-antitoxin system VapC family toxin [Gemmataceae bacterium]|nr:type II toxin-antitoxin system VapC family toxin [Gemmataceae bacterium]